MLMLLIAYPILNNVKEKGKKLFKEKRMERNFCCAQDTRSEKKERNFYCGQRYHS